MAIPMPARPFRSLLIIACSVALALLPLGARSEAPGQPAIAPTGSPSSLSSASGAPVSPALASPTVPELQAAVRAIASDRALEGSAVGIAILDVDSGRMLAAINEHAALNPASNAKLYTAGAALAILRGEHRYETTLSGKLEGDAVAGPLVLRGYGDPSLTTSDLAAMVSEVKAYGVRRVEAGIAVDQRFYDDITTPPAFDQQPNEWAGFRAPVSAVAIDENCVTLSVRPREHGAPARADFDPPGFVDVDGTIRTGDPDSADNVELALAGSGSRMTAHLSGAIASDSRLVRYTRRVEDPRLLAGYALKAQLERADIQVAGEIRLARESEGLRHVLAKHASEPLSALLYALGKHSDNFYAEMIFKSLAGEAKARPARTTDSTELVASWLARIGAADAGVVIKNGSGLFDADRVTAWSTVALLKWAWRDPTVAPEYVAQLAVGGVDGTLRKRFRTESTRRRVRAKTGTLDDAIALSGYVLREGGRGPVAFSILFNRVGGKQDGARHAADRLVELVARTVK
jgi:D-alanyl-D-alanine carboxypeptidase/D-alanyl-D-alanine-endopeptidase (penicillin-binding protein 4)